MKCAKCNKRIKKNTLYMLGKDGLIYHVCCAGYRCLFGDPEFKKKKTKLLNIHGSEKE